MTGRRTSKTSLTTQMATIPSRKASLDLTTRMIHMHYKHSKAMTLEQIMTFSLHPYVMTESRHCHMAELLQA